VTVTERAFRPARFRSVIQSPESTQLTPIISASPLEDLFRRLTDEWISETWHHSTVERKYLHPAHLRIISLGMPVVPLILRELPKENAHWFAALKAITGIDVTNASDTLEQAIKKWIAWGRQHGLTV
jgi:hypothetical protein